MGVLGFIKSWLRGNRRAGITIRGEQVVTGDNFSLPGDDSQALPGDAVIMVPLSDRGSRIIIASLDTKNKPVAVPGEKRLYSRSPSGTVMAELWLKANGSVELSNASGSLEIAASGTVSINGVTIDASGNISTPGDMTAGPTGARVHLLTHLHTSAAPGSPTSPPIIGA